MPSGSIVPSCQHGLVCAPPCEVSIVVHHLQAMYRNAISALRASGEKGAQVRAAAELGDVHAHASELPEATTLWCQALDLLTGPYQVRICILAVCLAAAS